MDNKLQKAFVLHARPYKNTSLIVELYTQEQGRVAVVANSARGVRSQFRGVLQPFVPMWVDFSGRGSLKSLRRCELMGPPFVCSGMQLFCGFYANELIMRFLTQHGQPNAAVFQCYQKLLETLGSENNLQPALRYFELDFLAAVGYELTLTHVFDSHSPVVADQWYRYRPGCGMESTLADLSSAPGSVLLELDQRKCTTKASLLCAKILMRQVIQSYLDGRPLHSYNLFASPSKVKP